jgi:hypothetical protein
VTTTSTGEERAVLTDKYKKSSYSGNGGCVEIKYVSASSCYRGGCVEVGFGGDTGDKVFVRDSKDPSKPPHTFTRREWQAFLDGARAGEFDLPA